MQKFIIIKKLGLAEFRICEMKILTVLIIDNLLAESTWKHAEKNILTKLYRMDDYPVKLLMCRVQYDFCTKIFILEYI